MNQYSSGNWPGLYAARYYIPVSYTTDTTSSWSTASIPIPVVPSVRPDSEVAKYLAELPLAALAGFMPEPTEVFGYRSVKVVGGILTSEMNGTPWRIRDGLPYLRADCQHLHDAPNEWCSCGIYAWKAPLSTEKFPGSIVVKVQLWGTVFEHVEGYRAEHAAIVGVLDATEQAWSLACGYGIEYLPGTLPSGSEDEGPPVPNSVPLKPQSWWDRMLGIVG